MQRVESRYFGNRQAAAFTLIELLVVIAIIVILATIAFPAIRGLAKSNSQSQAVNLARTYLSTARTIAMSQHRKAGVVFFEESSTYSAPVHPNQTALQIIVEDFDTPGVFTNYSFERQYLPPGVKVATLSDSGVAMNENTTAGAQARAVVFDPTGQLVVSTSLAGPTYPLASPPNSTTPGTYPQACGDWQLAGVPNKSVAGNPMITQAYSSPGFFLFNQTDYQADYDKNPSSLSTDIQRTAWIRNHADVVIVNSFTGGVNR
jgi:prepilin-type N-terminal cleavage/methylation domain-containing protein